MSRELDDAAFALALAAADLPCNNGCGCEEYDYCAQDECRKALGTIRGAPTSREPKRCGCMILVKGVGWERCPLPADHWMSAPLRPASATTTGNQSSPDSDSSGVSGGSQ